jgi:uncharacterized membrane protein
MRQIHVQVRRDRSGSILELANRHQAFSPVAVEARTVDGEDWSLLLLNLPNDRVGSFLWEVREEVEDAYVTLFPTGALPVQTPFSAVHERVRNVAHRSTLELVLDSLQSVGSWRGMLLYAFFSGVVAAYGVIFSISWLLVAAMLIAPMGAPAMVSVIGTAIGDWRMVGRGALRFGVAILVLIASAVALGFVDGLRVSTAVMEEVTALSGWTFLVALVAGAAGAQSQVESSRASLVTGTATGFLIAAALSPTSAVLGLAVVLRRWDYVSLMAFQLVLQYAAIVTGGWMALRLYGIRPSDPSLERGSPRWRAAIAGALAAAVVGLVAWQVSREVRFRKADASVEVIELARDALDEVPTARLVEASAHFTRPDLDFPDQAVLIQVVVGKRIEQVDAHTVETRVREAVVRRVRSQLPGVVPYVDVTVIPELQAAAGGGR